MHGWQVIREVFFPFEKKVALPFTEKWLGIYRMFPSFSLSRSFTPFSPLQFFQYFLFHLELHLQNNHHPPGSTDIRNTQYHPLVVLMFQNVLRTRKSTFRLILMTASLLREFIIAILLKPLWPWGGTESSLLTVCFDIKGMIFHSWLWWHHLQSLISPYKTTTGYTA